MNFVVLCLVVYGVWAGVRQNFGVLAFWLSLAWLGVGFGFGFCGFEFVSCLFSFGIWRFCVFLVRAVWCVEGKLAVFGLA